MSLPCEAFSDPYHNKIPTGWQLCMQLSPATSMAYYFLKVLCLHKLYLYLDLSLFPAAAAARAQIEHVCSMGIWGSQYPGGSGSPDSTPPQLGHRNSSYAFTRCTTGLFQNPKMKWGSRKVFLPFKFWLSKHSPIDVIQMLKIPSWPKRALREQTTLPNIRHQPWSFSSHYLQ